MGNYRLKSKLFMNFLLCVDWNSVQTLKTEEKLSSRKDKRLFYLSVMLIETLVQPEIGNSPRH